MSALSLWSLPLNIQRRGNFFSDIGFEDYRRHFESAAQDLLKEFDFGCKEEDSFKSYRRLRDRQLSGTDRTAKIAEENDKYKIVMDVEGFEDANLQVKVLGPNSICIEGTQEYINGGTTSKKRFRRRFSLPNLALVEDASSNLSSDNVLTVNIPKKIIEIKDNTESKPVEGLSQDVNKLQEEIEKSFRDLRTSSLLENSNAGIHSKVEESSQTNNSVNLPIATKDSFFNDSFFEKDRSSFQKSVQDIVNRRSNRIGSVNDVFSKVREVKQEEAQAMSVSDEENQYKIIFDVHGFTEADLKVNAVSEHELSVEGCTQKTSKYTNCSNSFKRQFTLPTSVDIRKASSAISSDGILTILVPKKQTISSNFPIPVMTQEAVKNTITQSDKSEHIVPIQMTENCSTNNETNLMEEHLVHSKVYGEDKRQQSTHSVMGPKSDQSIPINLEEGQLSQQISKLQKELQNLSSQSQQENREFYVPVTLESQITSERKQEHIQETSCQSQDAKKSINTVATQSHDRLVPISFKGSFYDNSIFDDTRKNFEMETEAALDSFKGVEKVHSNVLQRSSSTFLDDATHYKIVLDVFGYDESELKIRASGVNEITIEGISEKSTGGTKSKKSFYRSFQLPSYVDLERTSTALSTEGILTVTVPKKNQVILKTENVIPITSQLSKSNEQKITLVVDGTGVVQDQKVERKFPCSIPTSSSTISSFETKEQVNLPTKIEEFSDTSSIASSVSNLQREDSLSSQVSSQTMVPTSLMSRDIDTMLLPIVPKGNFFDDTFFQDSRSMFESALRNTMVNRFCKNSFFIDEPGFYKSLRQRRITDGGNQTASITEDDQFTNIVIDVNGFDENSLSIKFDKKNEITVEGDIEEKSDNSICKKRFRRSFFLPTGIPGDSVTSALSIDGVLSIKIPKVESKPLTN